MSNCIANQMIPLPLPKSVSMPFAFIKSENVNVIESPMDDRLQAFLKIPVGNTDSETYDKQHYPCKSSTIELEPETQDTKKPHKIVSIVPKTVLSMVTG